MSKSGVKGFIMFKRFFLGVLQIFKPNKQVFIALSFGVLAVAAFEPIGIALAAIISLAGLFWVWMKSGSLFDGFKTGFWFGLGMFGVGASWLMSSLYLYSNIPLILSLLATFIFVAFLASFAGLAGLLASYFYNKKSPNFILVLIFPAAWVLLEWTRSTIFGGFPFLLIGNSHVHTWLAGYAPVLGVLGVSWAVALTAAALVWIITQKSWLAASTILAVVWAMGLSLKQIEWVSPIDSPVKVALLQGNISQDQKWLPEVFIPSLSMYVDLTKQNLDADLIVWPETAVASYFDRVQKGALRSFLKEAPLLDADILIGVITRDIDKKHYYNAIVHANNPEQEYRKSRLVPFSEYFPFPALMNQLSEWFNLPFSSFTPGEGTTESRLMTLAGHEVGLSICFEAAFGAELALSLPRAKFLVTISNDAWFAHTLQPAQQLQDVQMRALELGREIARSTNTGYTAIIDITGNIKYQIPAYEEGVLRGEIQPYEGLTFFAEWKHIPILAMLSLIFGFIIAKRNIGRKKA